MRIVTLCGSLGSTSANRMALDAAVEHLVSAGVTDSVDDVPIASVPMLDPALVDEPPSAVAVMRSMLEAADGVLLAAPEYAGGLSGGTKNALDWLVGSASIHHVPIAVLSAGTTGGEFAVEQLVRTLSWQGGLTVATLGISAPRMKMEPGRGVVDVDTVRLIERWADDLVSSVSMDGTALFGRVADVVTPFGIDPARFGELRARPDAHT